MAIYRKPGTTQLVDESGNIVQDQNAALASFDNNLDSIPQLLDLKSALISPSITPIGPPPSLTTPKPSTTSMQASTEVPMAPIPPKVNPATGGGQYVGSSIVDYLKSTGQPASFLSRQTLAQQHGIKNYTGTAQQNTQLLNALKSGGGGAPPAPIPTSAPPKYPTPSGSVGNADLSGKIGTSTDEFINKEQELFDNIAKKYGLIPADPTSNPVTSYADYYKQAFSTLGLDGLLENTQADIKNYTKIESDMNSEIKDVNDDPWLSVSQREEKIGYINNKYSEKLTPLSTRINLNKSLYESGRSDAQHVADTAISLSHQKQQINQDIAFKMIDMIEKQLESERALAKQQENDPVIKEYQLAKSQGYSGTLIDFLKTKKQQTTINLGGPGSSLDLYRVARAMSAYESTVQSTIKSFYPSGKSPIQIYGTTSQAINRVDQSLQRLNDPTNQTKGPDDLDLVDAYIQIARGGQQITEAQIDFLKNTLGITATFDRLTQKITGTSALDPGTRKEIATLSHRIFEGQKVLAQKATDKINAQLKKQKVPEQFLLNSPDDAANYYNLDLSGEGLSNDLGTSNVITAPDGQQIIITD